MDTNRQKTLERVVNEIMLESGLSKDQYARVLSFAIKGIREANVFVYGTTMKCAKLITDNNHMVDLPSDYLDFVAIGIPYNGELVTFTIDNRLIRTVTSVNGVSSLVESNGEGVVKRDKCTWGYGVSGGKNDYYYCIDLNMGKIILNSTKLVDPNTKLSVNKEIQLWYVSSGINLGGETVINTIISDFINAYVMYYYQLRSPIKVKADAMKIGIYEQDYEKEYHKLKMLKSPTSNQWEDFFCSMFHQTPGR